MANRFETEFPKMDLRLIPPLIGPDGLQHDWAHEVAREVAWREAMGPRAGEARPSLRARLSHVLADIRGALRRPPALTPHYR